MSRRIADRGIGFSINIIKHEDVAVILDEMKSRNINFSATMRELLRDYRDRGYMTEAEYKEAVENGEVEFGSRMV